MSPAGEGSDDGEGLQSRRLDKWLWFARVVKSRTLAASLIEDGKVRLNRSKVLKPSQGARAGDVLTVNIGPGVRVLKVLALGERRGPATEARALYEDLTPRTDPGAAGEAGPEAGVRAPGTGRPTKQERRRLDRLKGR